MQSMAVPALKSETVAMTVTDRRHGRAPATLRCVIDGNGRCGGSAFKECAMSKHLSSAPLDWTGLAPSVPSFGGQPAVPNPHTARGRHATLTTAILAKTEHQVTQPTPLQAVSGAFSLSHA